MRNLLLVASLAVNIFIIGLFVGNHLNNGAMPQGQGGPGGPDGMRPPTAADWAMAGRNDLLPIRSLETLPPELRQQARDTIRQSLPQSRAMQREIANLRREVAAALAEQTLDEDKLDKAILSLQEKQFEQQRLTATTIQKVLSDLPDAERLVLLERIEEYRQKQRVQHQEMRQRAGERMRERVRERMQERREGLSPPDSEE
ncbi:MAG: periplasmic heavy metal sensor [Aquisalinus sp.]|nr:periplasmic heavy metal sensor [Aquisalinus sp.]